jgi:hypothetical protein
MLSLTACGETATSENISEKAPEVTTASDTAEDEQASEDDVTEEDADEKEITEDENSAEETEAAVNEVAVPTELSSKYADLDNRSFKYNGKILTVGVSTLQDLLDAGMEFEKTENYEKMVESDIYYYDEDEDKWYDDLFNGTWYNNFHYKTKDRFTTLYFANPFKNDVPMKDCVLVSAFFFYTDGRPDDMPKYELASPSTLTMDELKANSGTPTGENHDSIQYTKVSDLYPECDSGYDFRFNSDGTINTVNISWLP